ncbi:MAG TPA: hypothetical protein VK355_09695, partial [Candidatus Binatia bacterium]|nr:hypothetical protein [Candidatus Binatia bacterium]
RERAINFCMANESFRVEECRRRRKEVVGYLWEMAATANLLAEQFSLARQKSLSMLLDLREQIAISNDLMDRSYKLIEKTRKVPYSFLSHQRDRP